MNRLIIFLLVWSFAMTITTLNAQPTTHFKDGHFFNPFPGFEHRGLGDLLRWLILDRLTGKRPFSMNDSSKFTVVSPNLTTELEAITWIGHSTLFIRAGGLNILTDPIFSERCSPVQFASPKRHVPPAVTLSALPAIDVVVISHDHYDHLDENTIKQLGNRPLYLVPLGVGKILESWGITHYTELDWWDEFSFNGVRFICTPAQHFSGRSFLSRNKTLWASWLIKSSQHTIYYGGDSGYFPGFKEIGQYAGKIDVAALPIGAYRPRWFMSPVHLDPPEALKAFKDLQARALVAIHWGTFKLSDEPLSEPPELLRKTASELNIPAEKLWILKHGETRLLEDGLNRSQM